MQSRINTIPISDRTRTLLGFTTGLLIMAAIVQVFQVNNFDFNNMQRGVQLIFSGVNPWAAETRIPHYYNPPFAVLFLWPMLFASPKIYLVLGGALLFAFVFYRKAWVAFAWFATNTFLWLVSAGGIDMFVIGAGLLLLIAADNSRKKWLVTPAARAGLRHTAGQTAGRYVDRCLLHPAAARLARHTDRPVGLWAAFSFTLPGLDPCDFERSAAGANGRITYSAGKIRSLAGRHGGPVRPHGAPLEILAIGRRSVRHPHALRDARTAHFFDADRCPVAEGHPGGDRLIRPAGHPHLA